MPNLFRRKMLITAAIAVCLLLLLLFFFALWPAPVSGKLTVRVADTPRLSNGVLVMSVVLSNGATHSLNIVDDAAGNPLFALDAGTNYYPAGSPVHGTWLADIGNTMILNLAPGASLTNTVSVTSPPPRFRFRAEVRDFDAERRALYRRPADDQLAMPTSSWIELRAYQQ